MKNPELSIVMPVYNAGKFVSEAIESLLNQSFTDFELIVVDDGSTDQSLEMIKKFGDSRIKILANPENKGIVYSRNRGLGEARGVYYAPFDADDMAQPGKLSKQIEFLKKNPDYGMVGSFATIVDHAGKPTGKRWKLPAPAARIPSILLFRNYFVHSSLVIRKSAMPPDGYADGFDRVEDYLLASKISSKHKTCNLPEYLINYRVHPQNSTADYDKTVLPQDAKVYRYLLLQLEIELTPPLLAILCALKDKCSVQPKTRLKDVQDFLLLILSQNQKLRIYDSEQLHKEVINRWIKYLFKHTIKTVFHSKTANDNPFVQKPKAQL